MKTQNKWDVLRDWEIGSQRPDIDVQEQIKFGCTL